MSPEARGKAVKLLLVAPEDSHLSVYYPAGSRSAAAKELELFMIASTWADIIRDRDFKIRFEKYNQGPWHYADIFWKQTGGKAEMLENSSEGLAITKLYDFEKNLKDESLSDGEKAVNLAWFLHVASDIHNPVHNASRVTEIEPKGDSGANRNLTRICRRRKPLLRRKNARRKFFSGGSKLRFAHARRDDDRFLPRGERIEWLG